MFLQSILNPNRNHLETFHKGKYFVSFKRGSSDEKKKDLNITIHRVFEADCLRILLSDDDDPTFLCTLTVTRIDYEDLKRQQGLLIDFDNFPSQLVRLLQHCAANNMFIILQQANPAQYYFEIVEHNEFKRLVHLSLKTVPASDADIIRHMAETISMLKKSMTTLKNTTSSTEAVLNDKLINTEKKLHEANLVIVKMEDDKLRKETEYCESLRKEKEILNQERLEMQKNLESATRHHNANLQDAIHRKDKQIEEVNSTCKQLKENIQSLEIQLSERYQRMGLLEKEVQKSHIEVATLKAKNTSLERDVLEKEKHIHRLQTTYSEADKILKETNDKLVDANSTVQVLKKEKASLEERLAISDSLANKNNQAAQSTSEQLLKANQIIAKQSSDLIELKEKLLCRTAIALEQEKVIEKNSKEIEECRQIEEKLNSQLESLRTELQAVSEKLVSVEKTLNDKDEMIKNNNMVIEWLHKKLEDGPQLRAAPPSSTPRLPRCTGLDSSPAAAACCDDTADDLPNFYATSKQSSLEDSGRKELFDRNTRTGLDPKYLMPAETNSKLTKIDGAKDKGKGKENKTTELPKVYYNEKKSSKPVSYRATPVSAYFP